MLSREKQLLFERQAEIVKAMAHPLRIAILDFLRDGERCVRDIAGYLGSERSNVSRHLSVMVKAGVLEYRKEGLKVIYKLRTLCILKTLCCITNALKQQIEDNKKILDAI